MRKEFKEHIKNISKLISYSLASIKIKRLIIEEEEGDYSLRPQLHILLRAHTGSLKSTVLREIALRTNGILVDEATSPGLVGTIDSKTFQFIPGVAWVGRNRLILMDEFKIRRKTDDWVVFLKLLEDQYYSKRIGVFSGKFEEYDDDLFVKVDKGQIEMKTRCAFVVATMKKFEFYRSEEFKAFLTRCIPYEYKFDIEEIKEILRKGRFLKVTEYNPGPEVRITKREYSKILNFVDKHIERSDVARENFARIVGDLVRIHAVKRNFSGKEALKIIEWKLQAYSKVGKYYKKGGS